ncbi:hypothetical protein RF11_05963 [Thelohanellus kitauei]|uniref:Uncharacterized protein n=1 Tax=Thelohanellus kitauei TaxID=669202 RepID=A0A0C2MTE3_THEKT|nr:hypothetical protein RF11_05963 [Thelohanellus kitauei]
MMSACQVHQKNILVAEVRENVKMGLKTLFQLIPIQPHLNHMISIIRARPCDYPRIISCFLFISSIVENSDFPFHFNEIMELINNIQIGAPELLIETCCGFLKDVFDHYHGPKKSSNGPTIVIDPVFKWLAQFPESVHNIMEVRGEVYTEMFPAINSDFRFINNVVVFCREITGVEILAGYIKNFMLNHSFEHETIYFLENFVYFYSEDISNNKNRDDSVRFALFVMTAFSIVTDGMTNKGVISEHLPIIEKASDLCLKVIDHFKDYEELCLKTSDVLCYLVYASEAINPDHEKLSERLVEYYQTLGYSCFIRPYLAFLLYLGYETRFIGEWFLRDCKVIFEKACDFLPPEDSNRDPRHLERVLRLLSQIISKHYDDILENIDIERLVYLASQGLLSQEEKTFNQCYGFLIELFDHPTTEICKKRPETHSIVARLYNGHVYQIVKNCIEVILTQKIVTCVKGCGRILSIFCSAGGVRGGAYLKIEKELIVEMLEKYPNEMCSDGSISDEMIKILNARSKEEAENLAAMINSILNKCHK